MVGQPRCESCGQFCGVVYRSAGGAGQVPYPSCTHCGIRPPKCSHEDGTVTGCHRVATHEGAFKENRRDRPWCHEHAPDDAEPYPYVVREVGRATSPTFPDTDEVLD